MPNTPIRAESAHVTLAPTMTAAAPVIKLLGDFDREKLEAFIEISVSLLDYFDGDPDIEANGDERDVSYCEYDTTPANSRRHGRLLMTENEDDDPREEDDPCGCEHDGREPEEGI